MRTKEEKLARLRLYATRYEIAAVHSITGLKWLVMYSQTSRSSVLRGLQAEVDEVLFGVKLTRIHKLAQATGTVAGDWTTKRGLIAECGDWRVVVTGRTQREAIIEGELPSIYRPQPMEVAA
jgi:hypothetical protein